MSPRKRRTYRNLDKNSRRNHPKNRRSGKPWVAGSRVSKTLRTLKGTVDKNRRGFGFVVLDEEGMEDLFLSPRDASSLFHGDRVQVTLSPDGEIIELKVLEHRFKELIGRYLAIPHHSGAPRGGLVVYERKRAREEVYVPGGAAAQSGDWVRAELRFQEVGAHLVTAKVIENYGTNLPPSADIVMLAGEFNLTEEHSRKALDEARTLAPDLNEPGRRDLRHIPFITIDGETARDFDDAVYVERDRSGYILWVGIADVSHYVREGTAIDSEAYARGTSVYFAERAFHMLPRPLSEGHCSLRPHEPKLAFVARLEIDHAGRRTSTELFEAVIESKRRATYNEIEKEWRENRRDKKWEYAPHFELYRHLRKLRADRGSIDFDLPEAEVVAQSDGTPVSITQRQRLDSHRLIEEFMIAANEAVTEWIMSRGWPFIYRVHAEPAEASLAKFQDLARTVGISVSFEESNIHLVLSDLVRRLEGHQAGPLLNMALLRSMKQAVYSAEHGGHFGLASKAYTHFTSPIRRYPDLVVHRLLKQALRTSLRKQLPPEKKARQSLAKKLEETAEHCSYRERLAADAERESIRLKQVRLIQTRLGDEFEASVIGMTEKGLFVQIKDPYVEGMISSESMTDDYYEYNEDRMVFAGKRKKRTFRIGDPVRVRAVRADLDQRQIDFALITPA